MTDWHHGPMAAFDTETTGVDVDTDRIVTAALWRIDPTAGDKHATTWLAHPGVDIPQAATNIHGLTTEYAHTHGRPAREVVAEIAHAIAACVAEGVPVVVFNAAFDITVLDRELARHGHSIDFGGLLRIIDPMVLDRNIDWFRRGKRRLADVCAHYGIPLDDDDAHGCRADALAAARLAWKIGDTQPRLAAMSIEELHDAQRTWRAEQAASLEEYLRRTNPTAVVEGAWPLIPAART